MIGKETHIQQRERNLPSADLFSKWLGLSGLGQVEAGNLKLSGSPTRAAVRGPQSVAFPGS